MYKRQDLEDPANEPQYEKPGFLEMGVSPIAAPDKATYVTIDFEKGIPVAVDGVNTVSYTHLDVYKRQRWFRPITIFLCIWIRAVASICFFPTISASRASSLCGLEAMRNSAGAF